MRARITKRKVDGLPMDGSERLVWDDQLAGFGLRWWSDGWSYLVKYRIGTRQRWLTLGRHGSPAPPDPETGRPCSWTPDVGR
jgi:hypothetical protein